MKHNSIAYKQNNYALQFGRINIAFSLLRNQHKLVINLPIVDSDLPNGLHFAINYVHENATSGQTKFTNFKSSTQFDKRNQGSDNLVVIKDSLGTEEAFYKSNGQYFNSEGTVELVSTSSLSFNFESKESILELICPSSSHSHDFYLASIEKEDGTKQLFDYHLIDNDLFYSTITNGLNESLGFIRNSSNQFVNISHYYRSNNSEHNVDSY